MRERFCCHCPLCRVESELLTDFLDSERQESCRQILSSAPQLAVFSGPGPLLEHLRLCRETTSSDAILRALLHAKDIFGNGIVDCLFILAFLPSMHASLRHVAKRYPQLSPEDASQQALQSLLRFLGSEQLAARPTYLGFAISRRVKRATFEWAEQEMRARVLEPSAHAALDAFEDSFERLALLRHFLDRAVRRGVLTGDELNLLVQFKLENGAENGIPEGSSNAHRQRLKRLLAKLRLLAEGQHPSRQQRRKRP
jgi:hypothetical protein